MGDAVPSHKDSSGAGKILAWVLATALSWLAASLLVLGVFAVGGEWLKSLSLYAQVLIISGVLVVVMMNLVGPVIEIVVGKMLRRVRSDELDAKKM